MHSICFLLLFASCHAIRPIHSYPNMTLIPEGYTMWASFDERIHMYLTEKDKICEMTLNADDWLVYQVRYLHEPIGEWKKLLKIDEPAINGSQSIPPTPITCFWWQNGPAFVIRMDPTYSILRLETLEGSIQYEIYFNYDLMSFDVETRNFYIYHEDKLFRMKVDKFVQLAAENENNRDRLLPANFPVLGGLWTDWSDFMVINGHVYFVYEHYIYEWIKDGPHLISRTFTYADCVLEWKNLDRFHYILNPNYEDDEGYSSAQVAPMPIPLTQIDGNITAFNDPVAVNRRRRLFYENEYFLDAPLFNFDESGGNETWLLSNNSSNNSHRLMDFIILGTFVLLGLTLIGLGVRIVMQN